MVRASASTPRSGSSGRPSVPEINMLRSPFRRADVDEVVRGHRTEQPQLDAAPVVAGVARALLLQALLVGLLDQAGEVDGVELVRRVAELELDAELAELPGELLRVGRAPGLDAPADQLAEGDAVLPGRLFRGVRDALLQLPGLRLL